MTITIPKTKGNQSGDATEPKCIFANPLKPAICPVLSLAVFYFCRQRPLLSLFREKHSEDRFGSCLRTLLERLPQPLLDLLGVGVEEIGTHSGRKGASTFSLLFPDGPSPIAVFKRAGA